MFTKESVIREGTSNRADVIRRKQDEDCKMQHVECDGTDKEQEVIEEQGKIARILKNLNSIYNEMSIIVTSMKKYGKKLAGNIVN